MNSLGILRGIVRNTAERFSGIYAGRFWKSAGAYSGNGSSDVGAATWKKILDAYKARRNPKFSAKLFTKGGLLKADLIAKNI